MYDTPYRDSLAARVLSATGVGLINILYDAAIEAVADARRHLAEGNIAERSRSITKAVEILIELDNSLDIKAGGELSARLSDLYGYIQRGLLDANYRQADDRLAEAEALLKTLRDAWSQVASEAPSLPQPEPAPEPALAGSSVSWSSSYLEPAGASRGWSA